MHGVAILPVPPVFTPLPIPAAAGLILDVNAENLDGSNNATLTQGQVLTSISNRGTRGGSLTGAGAATFDRNGGIPVLVFDGTGGYTMASAFSGPVRIAIIVYPTISDGVHSPTYIDGLTAGGRCAISTNSSFTAVNMGPPGFTSQGGSIAGLNNWSVIVADINGSSSAIYQNDPFVGDSGTGTTGSHSPTGFTIGTDFDNSHPAFTGSKIRRVMVWNGTLPTVQQIHEYLYQDNGVGWNARTALEKIRYADSYATPRYRVVGGSKHVFFGDSLTNGTPAPGDAWHLPAQTTMQSRVVTPLTLIKAGVGGNKWSDALARVSTDIVPLNPDGVVCEFSINDAFNGVPLNQFVANCQATVDILRAGKPTMQLMALALLARGENYPDPNYIRLQHYVRAQRYACMTRGMAFADIRADQQAFEATNNIPAPGNFQSPGPPPLNATLETSDGVHCNAAVGAVRMSAVACALMDFSG